VLGGPARWHWQLPSCQWGQYGTHCGRPHRASTSMPGPLSARCCHWHSLPVSPPPCSIGPGPVVAWRRRGPQGPGVRLQGRPQAGASSSKFVVRRGDRPQALLEERLVPVTVSRLPRVTVPATSPWPVPPPRLAQTPPDSEGSDLAPPHRGTGSAPSDSESSSSSAHSPTRGGGAFGAFGSPSTHCRRARRHRQGGVCHEFEAGFLTPP
jgi:hypothetical protein